VNSRTILGDGSITTSENPCTPVLNSWDRGFESWLKHGYMVVSCVALCCVGLQNVSPPSKESYETSKGSYFGTNSESEQVWRTGPH
jgi:hypothetical protein